MRAGNDNQPYHDVLFYSPLQHLFFIGPIISFYVESQLNPSFNFTKRHWLHLLAGGLLLLYSVVIFVTDKILLHQYYFLENGKSPDFALWYQSAGFLSMSLYFFISIRYFRLYQKLMLHVVSYAGELLFKWVRNFLYAFPGMLLLRLIFHAGSYTPVFQNMRYIGSWWEYFSFAIIF